ncbi:MAG: hypothetical protein WBF42_12020, partial [Terracidiphilus sp.]
MDAKYYAYNQTRGCFLSGSLELVDAGHEPLRVLKVLIEGLTPGAKSGLWLTHFRSVPVARTLSPFDLVYLDSEFRVVHAIELSTDGEFAPFRGQPASALVLPYQSLASTQTQPGDQLIVRSAEDAPAVSSGHLRASSTTSSTAFPTRKLTIATVESEPKSKGVADRPAETDKADSPLEQFLAQQSAISSGRGRVQQTARSLRDLSSAERAPVPGVQPPVMRSAPAISEPAGEPRAAQTSEIRSGPKRWPRIAPPSASAPPARSTFSAASASSTAAPQDGPPRKASWKVAQFPSRNGASPAPPVPATEPADEPANAEIALESFEKVSFEKAPPEKASLLMKILRLRFIHTNDQSADEAMDLPSPGRLSGPAARSRSVPDWAMRFLRWLYPELDIATAAEIAVRPTYDARTKFRHEVEPSSGMKLFKWVYPDLSFRHPV